MFSCSNVAWPMDTTNRSLTFHRVFFCSNVIGPKDMMMRNSAPHHRAYFCSSVVSPQGHDNEEFNDDEKFGDNEKFSFSLSCFLYSNVIGFKDMTMRGLVPCCHVFFCSNVAGHSSPH
jgi:hypothetical protein